MCASRSKHGNVEPASRRIKALIEHYRRLCRRNDKLSSCLDDLKKNQLVSDGDDDDGEVRWSYIKSQDSVVLSLAIMLPHWLRWLTVHGV